MFFYINLNFETHEKPNPIQLPTRTEFIGFLCVEIIIHFFVTYINLIYIYIYSPSVYRYIHIYLYMYARTNHTTF